MSGVPGFGRSATAAVLAAVVASAVESCRHEPCLNLRLDPGEACDEDPDSPTGVPTGSPYGWRRRCEECRELWEFGTYGPSVSPFSVLLVRDSSPSMCGGYEAATEIVQSVLGVLEGQPARLAVVTADGTVNPLLGSPDTWTTCAPAATPPLCPFFSAMDEYVRNKDGDVLWAVSSCPYEGGGCTKGKRFFRTADCLADVGAGGSILEWPLGSTLNYLWSTPDFVAPDDGEDPRRVPLFVLMMTNEDDCTDCMGGNCGPAPDSPGTGACGAASLLDPVDFVLGLNVLADPDTFRVLVLAGPPVRDAAPARRGSEWFVPSCTAPDGRAAAPAPRLAAAVEALGERGQFLDWCSVTAADVAESVSDWLPPPRLQGKVPAEPNPTLRVYLRAVADFPFVITTDPRDCPAWTTPTAPGECDLAPASSAASGYVVVGSGGTSRLGTPLLLVETAYPEPWAPGGPVRWILEVEYQNFTPQLI